jgi:hypothetical protein
MVVHDRHDLGALLVDLAVDEALVVDRAPVGVDGVALQVVLEDVGFGDELRAPRCAP